MKKLNVTHKTKYSFEAGPVSGLQQIKKTPYSDACQTVLNWSLSITGAKEELTFTDPFSNKVNLIRLEPGIKDLVIECEGNVEVMNKFGVLGHEASKIPMWLWTEHTKMTNPGSEIRKFAKGLSFKNDVKSFHKLMELINRSLDFQKNITNAKSTAEEAFKKGSGVCQDFANIFIACCRLHRLPARYVSGFLLLENKQVQEAMHAWVEVFVEGLGWVGFDTANKISPDDRYIRVAIGRDYSDAAPIKGVTLGVEHECLSVSIMVSEQ
jgi:transglutaminase-like putative cysteine protease|tara:strand:- start:781 stop:1581 length:801 start_codon:yes stop_codon:yes gene_type:complete